MITLTKRNRDLLSLAHDVYFIFIWFKFLALGKSLYQLSNLSDGLNVIQSNSLFLVRLIRNYLSMTQGIQEFILLSLRDISIASLILWVLFWIIEKRNMIFITIVGPLSALVLILLSLRSPTLLTGIMRINHIGLGVMISSTFIIFYNFIILLKQVLND